MLACICVCACECACMYIPRCQLSHTGIFSLLVLLLLLHHYRHHHPPPPPPYWVVCELPEEERTSTQSREAVLCASNHREVNPTSNESQHPSTPAPYLISFLLLKRSKISLCNKSPQKLSLHHDEKTRRRGRRSRRRRRVRSRRKRHPSHHHHQQS